MKLKTFIMGIVLTMLFSFSCTETTLNGPVEFNKLDKPSIGVPHRTDLGLGGEWLLSWTEPNGCQVEFIGDMQYTINDGGGEWRSWYNIDDNGVRYWELAVSNCNPGEEPPYQDVVLTQLVCDNFPTAYGEIYPINIDLGIITASIWAFPSVGEMYDLRFEGLYTRTSTSAMFTFSGQMQLENNVQVDVTGWQFSRDPYHNHMGPQD